MKQLPLFVATALALTASMGLAHALPAGTVSGELWEVTNTEASNATPAEITGLPGGLPGATFTVPSGNLSFNPTDSNPPYTLGTFLSSGGVSSATYINGAAATDSLAGASGSAGTLFQFTGSVTVTTGETFTAAHDDGLTLVIDGITVISAPGPTSAVLTTETYSGPSGTYAFDLVYGECCGPPAELVVNLPFTAATPLPAALPLFASGLGVVGFLGLRRKRKAAAIAV